MLVRLIYSIIVAAAIFSLSGYSIEAKCYINFELSALTDKYIYSHFEGAILRISAGTMVGTGFLIDASQGYILTAAHVIDEPAIEIIATSPAVSNKTLHLIKIGDLRGKQIDLALLQLVPPDELIDIPPIDISFRAPQLGQTAHTMGYSRGEADLSAQSAEISKITANDGIVVNSRRYPGDSGSPLLSDDGVAIAIARARIDNYTTHYTPMSDALELLEKVPMNSGMIKLDDQILSNNISLQELSKKLQPRRTASSARNIELVSWAYQISTSISRYLDAREMFSCPIIPAFWQRALDDAASLIEPLMSPERRAETMLNLGINAALLERNILAEQRLKSAYYEYAHIIKDYAVAKPDSFLYAFCKANGIGLLTDGKPEAVPGSSGLGISTWLSIVRDHIATDSVHCDRVSEDSDLASLLTNYSSSAYRLSSIEDGWARFGTLNEAIRAAAFAVGVTGLSGTEVIGKLNSFESILRGAGYYEAAGRVKANVTEAITFNDLVVGAPLRSVVDNFSIQNIGQDIVSTLAPPAAAVAPIGSNPASRDAGMMQPESAYLGLSARNIIVIGLKGVFALGDKGLRIAPGRTIVATPTCWSDCLRG